MAGDTMVMVRTSTFLSSLSLVFLILVLPFLLFGFHVFIYFVFCSQWTEQRSDCIQWVSVTVNALCSSSWVCCAVYRWNWVKYLLCISWNQPKIVLPMQCLCQYHLSYIDVSVTRFFFFFLPTQYLDNEVYWLCLIEVFCTYTKEFWGKKVFTSPQKTCPGSLMCDMYVCSHSLWF